MKIIWTNDIHLEFLNDTESDKFMGELNCGADAVLIAGDIAQARSIDKYLARMASIINSPVYFVLGNHDYYKGSITETRDSVRKLLSLTPNLHWLNDSGVVKLSDKVALVGHDGWADGRFGFYDGSSVELNDFHLIRELKHLSKVERLYKMQRLADEAATHLSKYVIKALDLAEHVIVVTHVPPWQESAWYAGKHSDMDYAPFFSSKVVGDVLSECMKENLDKKMTVLCGHTHGGGKSLILPNLLCLTGESEYGFPRIQEPMEI